MTAFVHCRNELPRALAVRRRLLCLSLAAAFPAHAATTDLTALSLEQLLDVTIVGASKYEQKQSEVAAAASVITRQEIRAFGWRTLAEALASLPGVYSTYNRQYTFLGTRGLGLPGDFNTRLLVTVDGNRVNDPGYDAGPTGQQFPVDMDLVERIEFSPGPGGAVYGRNAMFGVVNVVTRRGADVSGTEVAVSYQRPQALSEGRVTWGRQLDNGVGVLLSASGLHSRGEDRFYDFGAKGISGLAAGLDGERSRKFLARAARGAWSFDLLHSERRKDHSTAPYFSDPLVPGQYEADGYTLAQVKHQDSYAGDTLQVSGRLFMGEQRYRSILDYGTANYIALTSNWRGGELSLLSTAVAGHKLLVGLEAQDNYRQNQGIQDLAVPANSISIPQSGYRFGLYAQDEWHLAETLTTTLGLRADRDNVTGTKASPRAALIWRATPQTTLKALYGRAHRSPNVYERDYQDNVYQAANPALKGESIDTLELVADRRIGQGLTVRGSIYQWTLHSVVTLGTDPVSGLVQYQSGEDVKARGVELLADKTWEGGARLRGSLSGQQIAYAGGGKLLNAPKLLGKLNFSSPLPVAGLRLGYEMQYDSKRGSIDGTDLGGYLLSNLYLSTGVLARGLELSLGIRNLFDKRYSHPGSTYNWQNALEQDGRNVRVKLSYRF